MVKIYSFVACDILHLL